jgi:hypothetical protein
MPFKHYRKIDRRFRNAGKAGTQRTSQTVGQEASGEIPLSAVASFFVKHSLIATAALFVVGYTKTVTLAWLFGTTLSVFRLPLEETIAQGGMATVVILVALFQYVGGMAWGFVAIAIVTVISLFLAIRKAYLTPRQPRRLVVLDIDPRHKRFLNEWSGSSIRGMDLLISFFKMQFVFVIPFAIGVLSALVVYNNAVATSDSALSTITVMRSGKPVSFKATLVGEDDDRVYAFRKGSLHNISKADVVTIKKIDPKQALKSLKGLQHTGILPRTD